MLFRHGAPKVPKLGRFPSDVLQVHHTGWRLPNRHPAAKFHQQCRWCYRAPGVPHACCALSCCSGGDTPFAHSYLLSNPSIYLESAHAIHTSSPLVNTVQGLFRGLQLTKRTTDSELVSCTPGAFSSQECSRPRRFGSGKVLSRC